MARPINRVLSSISWNNATVCWLKYPALSAVVSGPRRWLIDVGVLGWVVWFAWQHAGFLVRDDLYLYGDHPGQFYRLWQLATIVWPEEGRWIGWSPYWHAGRPELQFYPPGASLLGWLLWMGSFQQLSLFSIYQIVVFISFILPAIGLYALLAWGLGDRLAGLASAWLAMTFPFPLGGVQGAIIGILGYQLAFGLNPTLVLSGLWLMRAEHKILPWVITGLILAGTMLLHPFQIIVPLGILGLYALLQGRVWQTRLGWLGLALLLGFGLTAFWWLPLSTQRQFFIPVIEGSVQDILTHFENMWFPEMGWLLAAALIGSFFRRTDRRTISLAILLGSAGMIGVIFFNALVLVSQFELYVLDSVRLIAGVTFTLLAGLALGVSELAWSGVRLLRRRGWAAVGLPLLIVVPWLAYSQVSAEYDFEKWIRKYQPRPDHTPLFLNEVEAKYRLSEVWTVMASTPGRVLYTSHYALLFDVPTSLKTITPILTGREILGGTFTLRSPVASYLWSGQLASSVLRGKVEAEDDKTLAGVAWEHMSDEFLFNLARRFNVTLIATIATDVRAQAFLNSSSRFKPVWSNKLFTLYEVSGYEPAWAEAENGVVMVSRYERTAIDVQIARATPGATLYVKVAHYPRWQAEAQGQPIPIQMDEYGLMRIALPPGSYTVQLRYGPSWPEHLGSFISLATAILALGLIFRRQSSFTIFLN
jgi:hypothetical protein